MSYEHLRPLVVKVQAKLSPEEMYILQDLMKGLVDAERERCAKIAEDEGCGYHNCAGDISKSIRASRG